jgi:hypothetical protein
VESIDAIITALYDVISGPAGEKRDWDRMRSLFFREATLTAVGLEPEGSTRVSPMTVESYIRRAGSSLEANGFFEEEVGRTSDNHCDAEALLRRADAVMLLPPAAAGCWTFVCSSQEK